jgi:hypothetical protein
MDFGFIINTRLGFKILPGTNIPSVDFKKHLISVTLNKLVHFENTMWENAYNRQTVQLILLGP